MTTMQSARLNVLGLSSLESVLRRDTDKRPARAGALALHEERDAVPRTPGFIGTKRTTRLLPTDLW